MKILKYIALLLLLVFIASSIFVATLNPDYNVIRTTTIKASKTDVFNYINDYKNWAGFNYFTQDSTNVKFLFPKNTIGLGSSYSWNGQDGEGKMTTIFIKKNDSLHQKMNYNGAISDVYWSFKNTKIGTKVIWQNVGKMDFVTKIFTTLRGGMDQITGNVYEKSLLKIKQNLKKQVKLHSITADGFIEKTMGMFVQKTINSNNNNIVSNVQIMITNLYKYLQTNNIAIAGKPFMKYNYSNINKRTTNISVCLPIKDSLKTKLNLDYKFENMLPFQAIKATLKGDLIYKNEAINKAMQMIEENNLIQKNENPIIEVYRVSKTDDKNSNNWITEIYIPVKKKEFTKKFLKPITPSSSSNSAILETKSPAKVEPTIEKIIIKKDFPQ